MSSLQSAIICRKDVRGTSAASQSLESSSCQELAHCRFLLRKSSRLLKEVQLPKWSRWYAVCLMTLTVALQIQHPDTTSYRPQNHIPIENAGSSSSTKHCSSLRHLHTPEQLGRQNPKSDGSFQKLSRLSQK